MAILTIRIPDETLEQYRKHNPQSAQKALEGTIERFKDVHPDRRAVVLSDAQRTVLEAIYGKPIEDFDRFADWVRQLVTVNVLGVEVLLKDGQRKRLKAEANFFKKNFEEYLEAKIGRMVDRELGAF